MGCEGVDFPGDFRKLKTEFLFLKYIFFNF